jgi:hypothetical protein
MYGTIARLHPKVDRIDELVAYAGRVDHANVPGFRFAYLVRPDRNPYFRPTMFLVVLFDDKDSYRANAISEEQHARFLELRELLEDDPDWMDGEFDGALRGAGAGGGPI